MTDRQKTLWQQISCGCGIAAVILLVVGATLPGLRKRLQSLGQWKPTAASADTPQAAADAAAPAAPAAPTTSKAPDKN